MIIILDKARPSNTEADPEILIIHCPRIIQPTPWSDWAAETVRWLLASGWVSRRESDCLHVYHPSHPLCQSQ